MSTTLTRLFFSEFRFLLFAKVLIFLCRAIATLILIFKPDCVLLVFERFLRSVAMFCRVFRIEICRPSYRCYYPVMWCVRLP